MKKLLCCILSLNILLCLNVQSQVCTPDPGCTETQLICPSTLSSGCEGEAYSQVITVALGATVQGVAIVDVTLTSVNGLPPGLIYNCNPAGCVFLASSSSCVFISGTPSAAGTFPVRVTLLVDIGIATIPIDTSFGTIVIFPACDDGDSCTTDACDGSGGCVYTPVICDDGDSCTNDLCINGQCIYSPVNCDDGDSCTTDVCDNGQCFSTAVNCDDGDSCTTDVCVNGACTNTTIPGCGTPCTAPTLSFDYQNTCVGDSAEITNNSSGIDLAATFSIDQNSDGSIDLTFPASAFPVGTSQLIPIGGDVRLTFIVENPGGCSDTLDVSITGIVCDDSDACTSDACANALCTNTPVSCDDSDPCTTDGCDASGGCVNAPLNCDDADSCTVDVCNNGVCINTGTCCASAVDCNDNDVCTNDSCNSGSCINTPIDCDDGYSCTEDLCVGGVCEHVAICCLVDSDCDDGEPCTTDDCRNGICSRVALNCNDNDPCTIDSCNNGQCSNTALNCDDGNSCTADACDNGQCQNTPFNCDDSDPCTVDTCDSGTCLNTAINCDDGDSCTTDICVNGACINTRTCCVTVADCDDNSLCTLDSCNSSLCSNTPLDCDDNYTCTADLCVNGVCQHLAICCTVDADCDDGDGCTTDDCRNGVCSRTPSDCDDNDACTTDSCDNSAGCINTPLNCDDGDSCTTDLCANGVCVYTVLCCSVNSDCNDNDLCTTDSCNNALCLSISLNCDDGDSCTLDLCDNGVCVNEGSCCASSADCFDGDLCTVDSCMNGVCVSQARCDDGDPCTDDYCKIYYGNNHYGQSGSQHHMSGHYDEDDDCHHDDDDDGWYDDDDDGGFRIVCYHKPKDCREGDACTTDHCDNGQCIHTPIVCNDGDSCTTDFCLNGYCKYQQVCCVVNLDCRDGDVCTTDSCSNGTCANIPKDCDDGDACTADVCDRYTHHGYSSARCKHRLIDCREGNICTADYCDSAGACVHDTIPGCCLADADCDDNDACTNEICYRSRCKYTPALNDLSIVEVPDFCQGNGVQLRAESSSAVSYSWSTGDTTNAIRASADSTYSVTVTDINGCQDSATHSISDASELLSSFVIIADEQVSLYNNTVFAGGVGASDNDGNVKLKNGTTVTAAGTFVRADNIYVSSSSSATTLISTSANVTLPAFESNPYSGGSTVNVPNNSTITLNGSIYGDVYIGSNCTVIFTQSDLYVRNLNVGDNSTVRFAECTRLHVRNDMNLGRRNSFNPDAFDVVVFVEDDVNINSSSTVTADIYARDGLSIRKGTSGAPNIMTGLFIAERVIAKDYTHWFTNTSCNDTCPANVQPLIVMKNSGSENTGSNASEVTSALPAVKETMLKAYPNPFTEKMNIEFTLPEDSKVTLEIFNLAGQCLAVVFDANVKANQLHKTEFTPQNVSEGVIIYRLKTVKGFYYGKAVMVR